MITNGTLLTRKMSRELVKLGLNMLWVSLDGASPESYTDIRLGATLPQVLENLAYFQEAIISGGTEENPSYYRANSHTQIGIAFVAMKRNIADLPAVLEISQRLGASRFMVTNVLPYSKEMMNEILYSRAIHNNGYHDLSLPAMDMLVLFTVPTSIGLISYGIIFLFIKNSNISLAIGGAIIALILGISHQWLLLAYALPIFLFIPLKLLIDSPRRRAIRMRNSRT